MTQPATFIFECSSSTYLDCVEKDLFGSNKPWPLQIKAGDYCLLHHYEIGGLLGLWQATCDGGKNLVPKVWGKLDQSRTLATLRDTLLPKLLSGELSVATFEKEAGL
ncbi:MAG: hypothetical protein WKF77_12375 [Planctomycetaceae bacterium]